jgi:hypothetical protein
MIMQKSCANRGKTLPIANSRTGTQSGSRPFQQTKFNLKSEGGFSLVARCRDIGRVRNDLKGNDASALTVISKLTARRIDVEVSSSTQSKNIQYELFHAEIRLKPEILDFQSARVKT